MNFKPYGNYYYHSNITLLFLLVLELDLHQELRIQSDEVATNFSDWKIFLVKHLQEVKFSGNPAYPPSKLANLDSTLLIKEF